MRILFFLYISALVLTGCSSRPVLNNPTEDFLPGKRLAELTNKKLKEVSGIAASISNPGYLWAHNDSQNGTEVFLISTDLKISLTCKMVGIENRDWEDIAVGPGPEDGKSYVYVGDIGDNDAKYRFKRVYRFEEPVLKEGVQKIEIVDFDTIIFRLPKKKDTEALIVDPANKNLYVISKREYPVHLYELKYPYSTRDTLNATEVMSLPFTQIVAGDISDDGKQLLLKSYEYVYYWSNPSGKPLLELLKEKPQDVPYEEEPQGESITWARDGSGFYTLSEQNLTTDTYLYFYEKKNDLGAR